MVEFDAKRGYFTQMIEESIEIKDETELGEFYEENRGILHEIFGVDLCREILTLGGELIRYPLEEYLPSLSQTLPPPELCYLSQFRYKGAEKVLSFHPGINIIPDEGGLLFKALNYALMSKHIPSKQMADGITTDVVLKRENDSIRVNRRKKSKNTKASIGEEKNLTIDQAQDRLATWMGFNNWKRSTKNFGLNALDQVTLVDLEEGHIEDLQAIENSESLFHYIFGTQELRQLLLLHLILKSTREEATQRKLKESEKKLNRLKRKHTGIVQEISLLKREKRILKTTLGADAGSSIDSLQEELGQLRGELSGLDLERIRLDQIIQGQREDERVFQEADRREGRRLQLELTRLENRCEDLDSEIRHITNQEIHKGRQIRTLKKNHMGLRLNLSEEFVCRSCSTPLQDEEERIRRLQDGRCPVCGQNPASNATRDRKALEIQGQITELEREESDLSLRREALEDERTQRQAQVEGLRNQIVSIRIEDRILDPRPPMDLGHLIDRISEINHRITEIEEHIPLIARYRVNRAHLDKNERVLPGIQNQLQETSDLCHKLNDIDVIFKNRINELIQQIRENFRELEEVISPNYYDLLDASIQPFINQNPQISAPKKLHHLKLLQSLQVLGQYNIPEKTKLFCFYLTLLKLSLMHHTSTPRQLILRVPSLTIIRDFHTQLENMCETFRDGFQILIFLSSTEKIDGELEKWVVPIRFGNSLEKWIT